MKIRAEGWRRNVRGWHTVADIKLAKAVRRRAGYGLQWGKTYVAAHGEDAKTAEGNLTVCRNSNNLALSGNFEVAVEFSELDLSRLLGHFFKDRSAADVWQFMAKVFRGRKRPGKAKRTRKPKARR